MYIHTYARIHISTYIHVYSLGVRGLKGLWTSLDTLWFYPEQAVDNVEGAVDTLWIRLAPFELSPSFHGGRKI
jgi:hypothetical protein